MSDLRQFLHAQAAGILAVTSSVKTVALARLRALVFIGHGTRRRHIGGVTTHPTGTWAAQHACNLALDPGEKFGVCRFLIRDRNSNFHRALRRRLSGRRHHDPVYRRAGTADECVLRAPHRTLRRQLLDWILDRGPSWPITRSITTLASPPGDRPARPRR